MGRWDNQDQTVSMPKKLFVKMLLACGIAGGLIAAGFMALSNGYFLLFHC